MGLAGVHGGSASDNIGAWVGWVRQPGGAYSEFTIPGASVVTPEDINNRGQIAGYFYDSAGISHDFLATPVTERTVRRDWDKARLLLGAMLKA